MIMIGRGHLAAKGNQTQGSLTAATGELPHPIICVPGADGVPKAPSPPTIGWIRTMSLPSSFVDQLKNTERFEA